MACSPSPSAPIRRWSPSSSAFQSRGLIRVEGDSFEISDGRRPTAIPRGELSHVAHRYRLVVFGSNMNPKKRRTLVGELAFMGPSGCVATLPGGWAENDRYTFGDPCTLPGWWRFSEVAAVLQSAGVPIHEEGVDEAAGYAYSPACPLFLGRPLPPACFSALKVFWPYLAWVLTGWALLIALLSLD